MDAAPRLMQPDRPQTPIAAQRAVIYACRIRAQCLRASKYPIPSIAGDNGSQAESTAAPLNVEVRHLQRIVLDERPPWLDHVAHQRREDLVRGDRILDPHL